MRLFVIATLGFALIACQSPASNDPAPSSDVCGLIGHACCEGADLIAGRPDSYYPRDPGQPCSMGSFCSNGYCFGGAGAPCDAENQAKGDVQCAHSISHGFCEDGRCRAPVVEPCGDLNQPACSERPNECRCTFDTWTCTPERCCMPEGGLCDRDPTVCCDGLKCDGQMCRAVVECGKEGGPCCGGCDPGLECIDHGTGARCLNTCGSLGNSCCAPNSYCAFVGNTCRLGTCCNMGGGDCKADAGNSPDPSKCCSGVCLQIGTLYFCDTSCGGEGQPCCRADESTSLCAPCSRCDGPSGTCIHEQLYCPTGEAACQPIGFQCLENSDCCSGMCDTQRGLCSGTTCYPNAYWCGTDSDCCSGYCSGNTCSSRPSDPPAPLCPSGTFQETPTGPCISRPAECRTGDIVCNCPELHGVWCHPSCEFEQSCDHSHNISYPCTDM